RGGSAAASRPGGRRGEIETAGSRGPRRWIGPARGRASPSRPVILGRLLSGGEHQGQRGRLAVTLDVVLRGGRVRVARDSRLRGRGSRERRAILVRVGRAGRGVERILEAGRQAGGNRGGAGGHVGGVDAVVANPVVL